jgi:hypothetical protein
MERPTGRTILTRERAGQIKKALSTLKKSTTTGKRTQKPVINFKRVNATVAENLFEFLSALFSKGVHRTSADTPVIRKATSGGG